MRSSLQLGLTVVVLLGVAVPPCNAGAELTKILTKITDTILLMIGETGSSVTFLGHPCLVVTAKQPYGDYAAQMSCCSWTDIIGEGRNTVHLQATKSSIVNFILKAGDNLLFTVEEVQDWLDTY